MKTQLLKLLVLGLITVSNAIACQLFESGKKAPHRNSKLTKFWAQEYTGADLVRAELKKLNLKFSKNLVAVWDSRLTDRNKHGERVAQLIIGPYESALLPSDESVQYEDVEFERGRMQPADKFEKLFRDCQNRDDCPQFINNSMSWLKSEEIKNIVSEIADSGSLVVTSAGNGRGRVELGKRKLAALKKIIVVGNTNKLGFPAKYTDSSPEVSISAPSDDSLTTHDYAGNEKNFSGTSGAAPQVLASLASFSAVTGLEVNGELALKLFEKSSINIIPVPNNIGGGTLNAYKIFKIGELVNKKCPKNKIKRKKCAIGLLARLPKFVTKKDSLVLKNKLKKIFPRCSNGSKFDILLSLRTCRTRKLMLRELREKTLLAGNDSDLWKVLSCISSNEGYTKNAQFYKNVAKHVNRKESDLIADYFKYNTDALLVKYVLSHPAWVKKPEYVKQVIKRGKADWTVDNYILSGRDWRSYFSEFLTDQGIEVFMRSSFIRQHL